VSADLEPVAMAPAAELAALRIAQEGLANAIKHAHASTIRLAMHRRGDLAEITVSDDGQGFVPNGNASGVDELGGSLTIESGEGTGTVISATLPLSAA
jgi:signal transduction histidine kinase